MFCVPLVYSPKEHHEQQRVCNIVSSFATTLNASSSEGLRDASYSIELYLRRTKYLMLELAEAHIASTRDF